MIATPAICRNNSPWSEELNERQQKSGTWGTDVSGSRIESPPAMSSNSRLLEDRMIEPDETNHCFLMRNCVVRPKLLLFLSFWYRKIEAHILNISAIFHALHSHAHGRYDFNESANGLDHSSSSEVHWEICFDHGRVLVLNWMTRDKLSAGIPVTGYSAHVKYDFVFKDDNQGEVYSTFFLCTICTIWMSFGHFQ
jgi:hypothetical protein